MSFQCAVVVKGGEPGERCKDPEPGDAKFLGFLTFCPTHQEAFEDLVIGDVLRREVVTARYRRSPLFEVFNALAQQQPLEMTQRNPRRDATVYFFRCEGFIKIGVSTAPRTRIKQVRAGTVLFPEGMDIASTQIVTTEPGGYPRESELHQKFAHLRHTGEWFTETPELTEYINNLDRSAAA